MLQAVKQKRISLSPQWRLSTVLSTDDVPFLEEWHEELGSTLALHSILLFAPLLALPWRPNMIPASQPGLSSCLSSAYSVQPKVTHTHK